MSGHTKGPWKVFLVKSGPNKGQLLGVGEETGEGVADAYGGLWGSGGEKLANAHLIAAAPELLEALEKLVAAMPSRTILTDDELAPYDSACAAIAKAKGAQS